MGDSLKAALRNLLAKGEAAQDGKLKKYAAAKKGPPAEMCPDCDKPLVDGKCDCGFEKEADDDGLAEALEQIPEE